MNWPWPTASVAASVRLTGSWIIAVPVASSTHWRRRAREPGSASVPAGRVRHTGRRY